MDHRKDNIYSQPLEQVESFRFDEKVVSVFSDMIERSVPGYRVMLDMIGVISRQYSRPNTHCYDLGCSLGASTAAILSSADQQVSMVHGIDNSPSMIAECQSLLERHCKQLNQEDKTHPAFTLHCQDLLKTQFQPASVVTLNFTLQFIKPDQRSALLRRIGNALVDGGALILSEKVRLQPDETDERLFNLHHDFKRSRGYSDLEIAQKRNSLENVLIPETIEQHALRLKEAGFRTVDVWFQCFNFISILAIK
jgi:tRNA (cmo5U34)-methyltransferase